MPSLVGSEMCIRDRWYPRARLRGRPAPWSCRGRLAPWGRCRIDGARRERVECKCSGELIFSYSIYCVFCGYTCAPYSFIYCLTSLVTKFVTPLARVFSRVFSALCYAVTYSVVLHKIFFRHSLFFSHCASLTRTLGRYDLAVALHLSSAFIFLLSTVFPRRHA